MRARLIDHGDRPRFNAAAATSARADVLQTWEWGEVKRRTGWVPLRFLIEDGDRVVGSCSVLRLRAMPMVPPLLYAPRGPVLDFNDAGALGVLLDEIRAHAGGAFLFKCDPPVERDSGGARGLARSGLRLVTFGAFGGVQPVAIMEVDLERDLDALLGSFKPKWRYNIRLAERKGVTIRPGTRADIPAFHRIYAETAARDGFTGRGRSYFETLFDVLEPAGMLQMFAAEFEGRMIAGIICTMLGTRVVYNYGASSNEHRAVMPNHLIQWHALEWAHQRGFKTYDFRGVSPIRDGQPVEAHIAGLNRFKEGFGARYVEYAGEFDLPLRAGWYAAWRYGAPTAMRLRARMRGGARPAVD